MDALGIEPNTFRMLSGCDNQLHHVPIVSEPQSVSNCSEERYEGICCAVVSKRRQATVGT